MKSVSSILSVSLIAMFIVGCVSSNFIAMGDKTYPPRPDKYLIDIYLPDDAPVAVMQSQAQAKNAASAPADALVVGRVDTQGAPDASWASVIEDAKAKARVLGGDALVIKHWGAPIVGYSYGQPLYAKDVAMTVIRYKEQAPVTFPQ